MGLARLGRDWTFRTEIPSRAAFVHRSWGVKSLTRRVLALLTAAAVAALVAAPAHAKTTQLPVGEYAWYWEDQKSVKGPDDTFEFTQNPYCPGTSFGTVEEVCKAGRLPVEVRGGDYKTPNKMSAVAFDFTLIPQDSDIEKFKVTFLEAKDHHSERGGVNHDRKKLQACTVLEYFGTGEAREYSEMPRVRCSKDDPRARHRVVAAGDDERHKWTFDLTALAQRWMDKGTIVTAILLRPVNPADERAIGGIRLPDDGETDAGSDDETDEDEDEDEVDAGTDDDAEDGDDAQEPTPARSEAQDTWSVVLLGPEERNGKGVETTLVYDPPPLPEPPPAPTTTTTPPATTTPPSDTTPYDSSTGFGTTTTGGSADTSTAPTTADDVVAAATPEPTPTPTPMEASGEQPVSATGPEGAAVEGFPWYMWLALLAGLVGFAMVRSVLLENATGVRPDGALAQIRKLNAERNGSAATAPLAGAGSPTRRVTALAAGARALGSLPRRAAGLVGRVRSKRG